MKYPFVLAITWESDAGRPVTERVSVSASSLRGAVNRGLRAAMAVRKGQRWSSVSILLERGKNRVSEDAQALSEAV